MTRSQVKEELLPVGPADCSLFSVFINVNDELFVDQKVGASCPRKFYAVAVIPLDRSVQGFSAIENDDHRRPRLHLFDPVKILRMRLFGRSRLLMRLWSR